METITKEIQEKLTPDEVIDILKKDNDRFVNSLKADRDLKAQVAQTSGGQYPFAAILGCIDSRVPAELIFDLGIGDIFNVRVAGNIVNEDVLGSLEYACKVAGAKVILVLGHTQCGAVAAAYNHVKLGNITLLLKKIMPAVNKVKREKGNPGESPIDEIAVQNVLFSIERIMGESSVLSEMHSKGEIRIVGALYQVETGKVDFIH